ncbi:hypothetical protein Q5P01_002187 [Channa striata]|uniref:Protein kinase domain-containing protein n=1 Tax=Channa striata TaxID=64152 RepID=A0AA88T7U1_CHASR|nr:hypothetical protein Q5P01_002187 [Channa striata]
MLKHNNIVPFNGHWKEGSTIYLFLKYCSGGALFDTIEPDVGMPEKDAHHFFQQLIAAVVEDNHMALWAQEETNIFDQMWDSNAGPTVPVAEIAWHLASSSPAPNRTVVSSQLQLFTSQLHADHSAPPPTVTVGPPRPTAPHQSPPTLICLTVDQVPT